MAAASGPWFEENVGLNKFFFVRLDFYLLRELNVSLLFVKGVMGIMGGVQNSSIYLQMCKNDPLCHLM